MIELENKLIAEKRKMERSVTNKKKVQEPGTEKSL